MRDENITFALRILLCGLLLLAWLGCDVLLRHEHPGYQWFLKEGGHTREEARRYVEREAADFLKGRFGGDEPSARLLGAYGCYEALAESTYGRPEDWEVADAYARQALAKAAAPEDRALCLRVLAKAYARKGRMSEAWRTASQAAALGTTPAERADYKTWAREAVAEGQKLRAEGKGS